VVDFPDRLQIEGVGAMDGSGITVDRSGLSKALADRFGDRCSASQALRDQHGKGEGYHPIQAPDLVVFPQTTEEVAEIVRLCRDAKCPMIPFGAGSSLEGHLAAVRGGVSIDLSRMDKIVTVNAEDLDCTVEAGVTRISLNSYLRDTGLFFPIDPGADATIGGMCATRASGTNAVRYGTMRENVLALTVVTADGRIIKTGTRARKSAAGYDLTRLYIGSEGTLGIITEITLKLYGTPAAITAAVCSFESLGGAIDTVIETIQTGVPIARVEFIDAEQMEAIRNWSKLDYPAKPTLFFEFHGSADSVREQAATVAEIAAAQGGEGFQWAETLEDRNRLWKARHEAYFAAIQVRPGCMAMTTDVCVPISRLAECVAGTRADLDTAPFPAMIVGHVGDGNFHVVMLLDPDSGEELATAEDLNHRIVARAQAMEGTCTGEHGIGLGKRQALVDELGEAVEVMRTVKRAMDPDDLMNPGKIFL
jgi:D-lactate dehydrogenase (cytochrome)